MTSEIPKEFAPRLCHIIRWPDFQGYGFNLHAEKGKAGQFIGKVDASSPADASGLKEGDRIVEVNGVNIGNENHQQVVTRIRQGGDETRLLVVDSASDDWFKDTKLVIRGDMDGISFGTARRDVFVEESQPEPESEPEPEPESEPEPEPEPEIEPDSGEVEEEVLPPPPVTNGNGINEDDHHKPRLCHLRLWPHFQGYGFNLHAERDKPGQYIGLVDDNSPASTAGLKVSDRIVEVNGKNIEKEPHSTVISYIKENSGEASLLVVDPQVDNYYREKGVTVHSSMVQVEYIATPENAETVNGVKKQEAPTPPEPEFTVAKEPEPPAPTPAPAPEPKAPTPDDDGLMLNLSVAEMKERLKAKKKQDPRHSKISFERKHQQFERM